MAISYATLNEPVSEEDVLDTEDYLNSQAGTMKSLFERVRYQGASPELVTEMWNIHCLLVQASERLAALRTAGCFPPDASVR